MATGGVKMNYGHYQNGKHGTLPQNPKEMELSQDMHLKMSKKIAQLTKVIYALNTKNDEHDTVIQSIKDQHELELQQLLAETKAKVLYFKQKVGEEGEHLKKIDVLQKRIDQHEKEKAASLDKFTSYKQEAEEREVRMRTEHSHKMLGLSQEVLIAKRDFESKLSMIDQLRGQYEMDKESAVCALEEKHKKELELVLRSKDSEKSGLTQAREELTARHQVELDTLHRQLERLGEEKKTVTEDYEAKLSKAQAFYDNELEALRKSQLASSEEQLTLLQEQFEKLKKDSQFREKQSDERIHSLLGELSMREEEISKLKEDLAKLESNLQNKDSNSATLNQQLQDVRDEAAVASRKLHGLEAELTASRQRVEQQASELVKKSASIGELEATKLQHESVIQDLQSQLGKLKDRITWLESAKHALESQTQTQASQQGSQLKSLEQSLEDLSIEKQKLQDKYDRDVKALTKQSDSQTHLLREEHRREVEALIQKHREELARQLKEDERKLIEMQRILETQLEDARSNHRTERLQLQQEYEEIQTELAAKLAAAESEVRRLEKILRESEQGLGTASSQLTGLKDSVERLKAELDQTRSDLRTTKNKNSTLTSEHEQLKALHEGKMTAAAIELKKRLEETSREIDLKWKETLRKELDKLQREITEQKDEDRRAALDQLGRMKDAELAALRKGWETKVNQLLQEISELKRRLDNQEEATSEEVSRLRAQLEAENLRLRQEMTDSIEEYQRRLDAAEQQYRSELEAMTTSRSTELQETEGRLRAAHMDELKVTQLAHRTAMESTQQEAERKRLDDMDALRKKNSQKLDQLRTELEHQQAIELEQASRGHQQQMCAARMELDRAIELTRQKDAEHAMKTAEIEEQIRHRETSMGNLESEISKLKAGINEMSHELDVKGKEMLRIRSEATQAARTREEQILAAHREEMENLMADHLREVEEMLADFSKAQELLKEKIMELQMMLEEAEERYRDRESRPEDLRQIEHLQNMILERQELMKKLVDDKKFYQMELVNRETNFNKVFSTAPNVGVLNPLTKPKSKGPSPMRFSSSPSLQKLDPLPGSPHHDEKFNNMRPLPPPTKKFVK